MKTSTMIVHARNISRRTFLANNPNRREIALYNKYCLPNQRVTRKQYLAVQYRTTTNRHTTNRFLGINITALRNIAFNKSCSPTQRIA